MLPFNYIIVLLIAALGLAVFEIILEGEEGWAQKHPVWEPNPDSVIAKIYRKINNDKPLTGYHVLMVSGMIFIYHLPFLPQIPPATGNPTLAKELQLFSGLFLTLTTEDFLWFALNPYYGLKKFRSENIWWHKKWWGRIPLDYPRGILTSLLFIVLPAFGWNMPELFTYWAAWVLLMLGLVGVSSWFRISILNKTSYF